MTTLAHTTMMRREIQEQPEAVARTLDALLPLVPEVRRLGADAHTVVFFARGSSDNAAVYGRYLLEVHAGRLAALGAPSVLTHYEAHVDLRGALVVVASQSGETQEILDTARRARSYGARIIAITNNPHAGLAREADLAMVTQAGKEHAVPATKSHVTQLAAMAVLGAALGPPDVPFDAALRRTPEALSAMLALDGQAAEVAGRLQVAGKLVVSGRGFVMSTALEIALKFEETCYITTLALSSADLQHGPIAVVERGTPLIVIAAQDGPMLKGATSLAELAAGRGSQVIGIGGDQAFAAACHARLPGPKLPEALAPLALAVPGQLLAEALARLLKIDPDSPRSLSKVTQTH